MAYYPGAPGYSSVSYGPGGSVTQTTTTYGAAPMMAPMMAPPMMVAPGPVMMGGPPMMGFPAPPSIWRSQVNWSDAYSRHLPFVIPFGVPPDVAMRMMRASSVFRMHDRDWSGNLDFHEFQIAMMALGYMMPPYELQRVFMMMDRDHSGRVNEREFAEYWGFYGYP